MEGNAHRKEEKVCMYFIHRSMLHTLALVLAEYITFCWAKEHCADARAILR